MRGEEETRGFGGCFSTTFYYRVVAATLFIMVATMLTVLSVEQVIRNCECSERIEVLERLLRQCQDIPGPPVPFSAPLLRKEHTPDERWEEILRYRRVMDMAEGKMQTSFVPDAEG